MNKPVDIPIRLATALLIQKGEISIGEITALPLVDDREVAIAIARILSRNFGVKRSERETGDFPNSYDEVISLTNLKPQRIAQGIENTLLSQKILQNARKNCRLNTDTQHLRQPSGL